MLRRLVQRFRAMPALAQAVIAIAAISLIVVAVSLALYPEWRTRPAWGLLLGLAAVVAVTAFLDTLNGARQFFDTNRPPPLGPALKAYLKWVSDTYKRPELRGLAEMEGRIQQLTLAEIYVSLRVALDAADEGDPDHPMPQRERRAAGDGDNTIDMARLLAQSRRIAITGGPGCGKTTYLKVIATALADAHLTGDRTLVERYLGLTPPLPLPIFVTLADYNLRRRDAADPGIRAWLNTILRQKVRDVPVDFFDRLLDEPAQPVIVLLDGLDEVADERERELVSGEVATLINGSRVDYALITSRTRAYRGHARLPDLRLAEVKPMTPQQVAQLAGRWCDGVYPTADQRRDQTQALIAAITQLEARRAARGEDPLIDTPLMVTVVAIVHYKDTKLPDQRAALYARCVGVLLEDSHHTPTAGDAALRAWGGSAEEKQQLLARLAFEMMSAGDPAGRSVARDQLEKWLLPECEVLYGRDAARRRLREFVTALHSRGGLIKERDGRYEFVHLTFQEFLAAAHLADAVNDYAAIVQQLTIDARATHSWWRETILLLVGYKGSRNKRSALALIDLLAAVAGPDELQLATAELAATAFNELEAQDTEVKQRLQTRLTTLLAAAAQTTQPATRLLAGDALAAVDDPRPGVGTRLVAGRRLPDIAWGGEVPAGRYQLGADRQAYSSLPARTVTIARPFRLARYPVTYAQFDCFLAAAERDEAGWWAGMPAEGQAYGTRYQLHAWSDQRWPIANRPRENVSWYQAIAFSRWLQQQLRAAGQLAADAEVDLPTEDEWEVAARYAGNGRADDRAWPWGADDITPQHANYDATRLSQTSAVGIFAAGRQPILDLYDLSGNVWEWCRNKFDDSAATEVDQSEAPRTLRGGSWRSVHGPARAASRLDLHPPNRLNNVGLRLVVRRPPSHDH